MNIDGLTQEEVEQKGSRKALIETLEIQVQQFYNDIDDEDIINVERIVGKDNVHEVMLELLYIVGVVDERASWYKEIPNTRKMYAGDVITLLAGCKTFKRLYPDNEMIRFKKAGAVVIEMEDVLYTIDLVKKKIGDGQIRTIPHCIIHFHFEHDSDLTPDWSYFSLPMIEEPRKWTIYQNGGYYTAESKCTLNLGASEQPQQVLDILNVLQSNRYRLHKDTNIQDYFEYKFLKGMEVEDANETIVKNNVLNTLTSFLPTIEAMKNKEFMFEFRFDFRGRIYNTAYNIALQGDSYQKGMIIPSKRNFHKELL